MGMVEDVLFLSLFRSEKKVSENSKEVFFWGVHIFAVAVPRDQKQPNDK